MPWKGVTVSSARATDRTDQPDLGNAAEILSAPFPRPEAALPAALREHGPGKRDALGVWSSRQDYGALSREGRRPATAGRRTILFLTALDQGRLEIPQ